MPVLPTRNPSKPPVGAAAQPLPTQPMVAWLVERRPPGSNAAPPLILYLALVSPFRTRTAMT